MHADRVKATRTRSRATRRVLLGRAALAAVAGLAALAGTTPRPAAAQDSGFAAPQEDAQRQIRIGVFGDSLADGIWAGLYRTLQRYDRIEVLRHTEVSSGLARADFFDWDAELADILADEPLDIAVVCIGLNDNQPVYFEGRRQFAFASEEWNAVYRKRISDFIVRLQIMGVPTFWVGLPTVRDSHFAEQMSHLNMLYESEAGLAGITFIPTLALTGDADGAYSAYLPDEDGRNRLMRANDGVHFTSRGYAMIAEALIAVMSAELTFFSAGDWADG